MTTILRIAFILLAMTIGLASLSAKPVSPLDVFYTVRPEDLAGAPGTLIRAAPIDIMSVYRAKAYRILYVSRNLKGEKIGVSGMMVVSTLPGRGATRPVVAWAHATTGVVHKCAPSRRSDPLAIPGIKEMIAKGYTVVATDYPGLGTPGPVPYLIGLGEAQSVLDSVKAARALPEAQAGGEFVLWGHSQGGHAALFAASLAKTYAADLKLLGVAAAAPATNLAALLHADVDTIPGRILAAMTLMSWSRNFGFPLDGLLTEDTIEVMKHIDKACVDSLSGKLDALSAQQDLAAKYLNYDPGSRQPWRGLLADNNPFHGLITVPAFIAQGADDTLVRPEVTAGFVASLCRSDKSVRYVMMPRTDHSAIAHRSSAQAVAWMEERFSGTRAADSCPR
ncbi:MAG: alpha/beta fold hydrolase [Pseudomonadota bacterium]